VVDINYGIGCHSCKPRGTVVIGSKHPLMLLHYSFVCYDHFIKKYKYNAGRQSEENERRGWAGHIKELAKMTREHFETSIESIGNVI
jgi:hypothetical protein